VALQPVGARWIAVEALPMSSPVGSEDLVRCVVKVAVVSSWVLGWAQHRCEVLLWSLVVGGVMDVQS